MCPAERRLILLPCLCALCPQKAAGVKRIVMCSPKIQNPLTLVAANECGVHEIYRVGGAQAVAAMSYGTTCVPKVDIIAGPGNIYVTMAKKEVFGDVKIDMLAGPSEILVIADKDASPALVAADMLSQAEHDKLSRSILVTDNKELAFAVKEELVKQTSLLGRKDIAEYSLKNNGAIIVTKSLRQAVEISDMIAPEHLEIATKNPDELLPFINNAGAVFAGYYTSEPLGDYYAGPSHVLPTGGTAKYFEALNTATFLKRISYIEYDKENIAFAADDIITLAGDRRLCRSRQRHKKKIGRCKMRKAEMTRKTKETDIALEINLDGQGNADIKSGVGFMDHMLTLFAVHGNFDLTLRCDGDIEVDGHHTVEDIGIILGKCIASALGDKRGINRYATAEIPMDEALARVTIDLSGRPFFVYNAQRLSYAFSNDFDFQLVEEFFRAVAVNGGITLHINLLYGSNYHHMAESIFKAFAKALSSAVKMVGDKIPSSKGMLD